MHTNTNNYEEVQDYLLSKYKRATIGRKELAKELDISMSTLDLYIAKKTGLPRYKKLGNAHNSRVIFNLADVAEFLCTNQIETL